MKITFKDHDGKGRRYAQALEAAGHDVVDRGGDVLLTDADIPLDPYLSMCDDHPKVVLYPHGAGTSQVGGDGQWPVHPHTVARFVIGEGHADILRLTGYPVPVHVAGWPLCEMRPFRPSVPRRVLLAPQHVMADGYLESGAAEANGRIHDLLTDLPFDLTVRFAPVGSYGLAHLGITEQPGVTYQKARFDVADGVAAIDEADVVIAADGTFPSLAIARGCPTIMYGQQTHDDYENEHGPRPARSWNLYADACRYPLDADNIHHPAELLSLIADAAADDRTIETWRSRFVSYPLNRKRFVSRFEAAVA